MNPDLIRVAIILCKRAPLKGEEAAGAAAAIEMLSALYDRLTQTAIQKEAAE